MTLINSESASLLATTNLLFKHLNWIMLLLGAEGVTKERAAETGQEGLEEEVPDYQDSLRRYTLALGKEGEERGGRPASKRERREGQERRVDMAGQDPDKKGKHSSLTPPQHPDEDGDSKTKEAPRPVGSGSKGGTEEEVDDEDKAEGHGKRKHLHMEHHRPRPPHPHSPHYLSPHHFPPPGAMMSGPANGYPSMPYPMPPYPPLPGQYPPHHQYPPHLHPPGSPGEELRNGGYPPHLSYYPPPSSLPSSSSAYRMPFYPTAPPAQAKNSG